MPPRNTKYVIRKKGGVTRVVQCKPNKRGQYVYASDNKKVSGKVYNSKSAAKRELDSSFGKKRRTSSSFGKKQQGRKRKSGALRKYYVACPDRDEPEKIKVCPAYKIKWEEETLKIVKRGDKYDAEYVILPEEAKVRSDRAVARNDAKKYHILYNLGGLDMSNVLPAFELENAGYSVDGGTITKIARPRRSYSPGPHLTKKVIPVRGPYGRSGLRRKYPNIFQTKGGDASDIGIKPVLGDTNFRLGSLTKIQPNARKRAIEERSSFYDFSDNTRGIRDAESLGLFSPRHMRLNPYTRGSNFGSRARLPPMRRRVPSMTRALPPMRRRVPSLMEDRVSPLMRQRALPVRRRIGSGLGGGVRRPVRRNMFGRNLNYGFSRYF